MRSYFLVVDSFKMKEWIKKMMMINSENIFII